LRIREDGGYMNFIARYTKVFAVLFLIFVSFMNSSAQADSIYRLPAGTRILLSLDNEVNSKVSAVDDTFTSRVIRPIIVQNFTVLPRGAVVEGRVIKAAGAGLGGKNGKLELRFETIRLPGSLNRPINGVLVEGLRPASGTAGTIWPIAGGGAAGAIVGAAARGEKGALAGAGVGAGAGSLVALIRKGRDVYLKTDQEFEIELKSDITLPASDY
jgi:hypothetical protein